jgi:indolepyruvate ferredoxin oxidoreductase alpha subunit
VQFVTGYPGSPSTATVEALLHLAGDALRVEWATNEKSAFDAALGASLAGVRSLVCLKSVGLNVALDSLMVGNLAPGDGGFVILAGDDPGGWSSQNEEDSRLLAAAAEVPLLEPTTTAETQAVMRQAFDLSEQFQVPVVVRITQALAQDRVALDSQPAPLERGSHAAPSHPPLKGDLIPARFERQPDRFNVLPIHVVDFHRRLQATLANIQARFEHDPSNQEESFALERVSYGQGRPPLKGDARGIIAAGHAYQKLARVLAESHVPSLRSLGSLGTDDVSGLTTGPSLRSLGSLGTDDVSGLTAGPSVRVLRLTTLHPLPSNRIAVFLRQVEAALVVEETAPFVETHVRAIAQHAGLTLPIYGRSSGHLPGAGELLGAHIALGLTAILPQSTPLERGSYPLERGSYEPITPARAMPSRRPLCDDCPYIPAFQALLAVMERHGGREAFIVTGETGCMVRGQLPPWEIMDLKYAMGSSIGLAAGLARTGIPQKIVALSGDSALLHSGLQELIDAVQADVALLVVVLANETTALSGGQPHPATGHDMQGHPRRPVDLVALIHAAGVDSVRVVDPQDARVTEAAFEEGLALGKLAVVVVQRACPAWERATE